MIELPEALNLAAQLNKEVVGKTVTHVSPPTAPHKFCWFNGDVAAYDRLLCGRTVVGAEGFGIYAQLNLSDDVHLTVNDGVNMRLYAPDSGKPEKYQLRVDLSDGSALLFTVAMYGGIIAYARSYKNEYFMKSKNALSALSEPFNSTYFSGLLQAAKPSLSMKAFLATGQRIPGLGNGVLQDILFEAGLHPKRKIATLSTSEIQNLTHCVQTVLRKMTMQGGRDTEKDLYGMPGGYQTILSKNTYWRGCPHCGGPITREAYLGGAVYYCPHCQPL